MSYCSIYKITNTVNNKIYIGQTWVSLKTRFGQHCGPYSGCIKLNNVINKYGKVNFTIEAIAMTYNQENADYLEILLIDKFNSIKCGYNLRLGGSRGKHSEESKIKMRKPKSSEAKINMSKAQLKIDRSIGRPHSEESKLKMKKPKSIEGKNNICKGAQLRKLDASKALRGKIGNNTSRIPHNKGKKLSAQQCVGMRKTKLTKEIVVMIRDDIAKFQLTYNEISVKYNVACSTIGRIASNKTHKL